VRGRDDFDLAREPLTVFAIVLKHDVLKDVRHLPTESAQQIAFIRVWFTDAPIVQPQRTHRAEPILDSDNDSGRHLLGQAQDRAGFPMCDNIESRLKGRQVGRRRLQNTPTCGYFVIGQSVRNPESNRSAVRIEHKQRRSAVLEQSHAGAQQHSESRMNVVCFRFRVSDQRADLQGLNIDMPPRRQHSIHLNSKQISQPIRRVKRQAGLRSPGDIQMKGTDALVTVRDFRMPAPVEFAAIEAVLFMRSFREELEFPSGRCRELGAERHQPVRRVGGSTFCRGEC
jgi:hypothetical protein